ncbi:unnamed protein product, partial [Acanthoscelides obtectus]
SYSYNAAKLYNSLELIACTNKGLRYNQSLLRGRWSLTVERGGTTRRIS